MLLIKIGDPDIMIRCDKSESVLIKFIIQICSSSATTCSYVESALTTCQNEGALLKMMKLTILKS